MIGKEYFVTMMERMVRRYKYNEEWIDTIEEVLGMNFVEKIYENDGWALFVETVSDLIGDTHEWLNYFFFEEKCEFPFSYWTPEKEIQVNNFEDLYSLIFEFDR